MHVPRAAALTAAALALAAAPAASAQPIQTLDITTGTHHGGTKRHPRATWLKVATVTGDTDPAAQPPATQLATLWFDRHVRFNGRAFRSCSPARLQSRGPKGCPRGSRVGSGTSTGLALGQVQDLQVTAYNASHGRRLLLYVTGSRPLQINSVIVATLTHLRHGAYGSRLRVPIPQRLLHPLDGIDASLTSFVTTVHGTARVHRTVRGRRRTRRVPYVQLAGCAHHAWHFKGRFDYTDGTSRTVSDTLSCRR